MQPIEATNVPVPQPEMPPCELWVAAYLWRGCWKLMQSSAEHQCDMDVAGLGKDYPVRKFHLTDQPPPPVDQAAVAEAFRQFELPDATADVAMFIARFVADLVANGVPRKEQTDAK